MWRMCALKRCTARTFRHPSRWLPFCTRFCLPGNCHTLSSGEKARKMHLNAGRRECGRDQRRMAICRDVQHGRRPYGILVKKHETMTDLDEQYGS